MRLKEILEEDLRARGKSSETIRTWCPIVEEFENVIGQKEEYNRQDVIKFLAHQREKGLSPNSMLKSLKAIRCLFTAMEIPFPKVSLSRPQPEEIQRTVFEREEVLELIQKAKAFYKPGDVRLAYLALSTTYGLRASELAEFSSQDIIQAPGNGFQYKVKIHTKKHGRPTSQIIPPQIEPYLVNVETNGIEGNLTNKKTIQMNKLFDKICKDLGFKKEKGFSWHSIRRSLVTQLVLKEVPALHIFRFLRWSEGTLMKEFGELPIYARTEQEYTDLKVFPNHPFLEAWSNGNGKKRGRPRKDSPVINEQKRPRGRPRKKRGRPRKQ